MSEQDAAVQYFVMTACNKKNGYNRAEIYPKNLYSQSINKVTKYHFICIIINVILINTNIPLLPMMENLWSKQI